MEVLDLRGQRDVGQVGVAHVHVELGGVRVPEGHPPRREGRHEDGQDAEVQEVPGLGHVLPDVLRPDVFTLGADLTWTKRALSQMCCVS